MQNLVLGIILLSIMSVGCQSESPYFKNPNLTPEEQAKRERCQSVEASLFLSFTERMKQKHGLEAIGFGGAGTRRLDLTFESYAKVDLAQARKLLIECVQEFVVQINLTEDLKECLSVPFTFKNVKIAIQFINKGPERGFLLPPFIAVARAEEGRLSYVIDHHGERLERIKEETYEEALEMLDKS